ncbi:DUF192 domain-containing protein [Candidatus Pacearchaeota archaeon]|nr:DUF192 domain-containing protein [Candidatus Pacearchaeota archaeon]
MIIDITISKNNRKISFPVHRVSILGKITGLMFRTRNTRNLLFEFTRPVKLSIHSWFVFFPFLIVWTDKKNNVIGQKVVLPFTTAIAPLRPFSKAIEVPFSRRNKDILDFFVDTKRFK